MSSRISSAAGLVFLFIISFHLPLYAQTSVGQITGTVTDPSGGVISGAAITITDTATQAIRTATTDDSGFFISVDLPIGDYSVEAVKTGYRSEKRTGFSVVADAHLSANFQLQVGAVTEVVTVTTNASEALNTTTGELSHVIDTKEIQSTPLNGRNYTQLMTLIPGSVVTNPDIFAVTTGLNSTNQVINGNRADSANLTVDGAFNQASGSNGSLINNVGADFIQDLRPGIQYCHEGRHESVAWRRFRIPS
jgi:hypothetical protein